MTPRDMRHRKAQLLMFTLCLPELTNEINFQSHNLFFMAVHQLDLADWSKDVAAHVQFVSICFINARKRWQTIVLLDDSSSYGLDYTV